MATTKRGKRNLGGRPVTIGASASYLLKLPPDQLDAARKAAAAAGIPLAEWWRRAGKAMMKAMLKRQGR